VLPRFCVRSVLFELPSSPDATMSEGRAAVRSICDSRSKFFRGYQYIQSSYLQDGVVPNGGRREMTRRANRRLVHRSKLHLYSFTSSARASSVAGTVMLRQPC
jgi:hypothetical protein